MTHNLYHSPAGNTDLQKMRDECQSRLDRYREEAVIHCHRHETPCDKATQQHYFFDFTEGVL